MEYSVEDRCGTVTAKRKNACGHLVEHYSERKQIRACVELLRERLLGRHVRNRTQRAAGTCQVLRVHFLCGERLPISSRTLKRTNLSQTKVENLGVPTLRDENVRGLNVTMNDSLAVGRVECIGDFRGYQEQLFQFHRSAGDVVFQRPPFQVFHGDECPAIMLADVIKRANVGMV